VVSEVARTLAAAEPRWREVYPFASHWFAVEGGRIHYLDEGPRDAPAVLMLHGNPTWSFYYRELIAALSPRFRVIAPDHLGCGLSDKPADHPYRLADRITHLRGLIDHLGLEAIRLVVHDWGGAIGMGLAVEQPERFERFVVMNTAAFPSRRIPPSINVCRLPLFGPLVIRGLNGFARVALIRALHHRERLTPPVKSGYLDPYAGWGSRVALLRFVQDIPMHPRHPSWARLESIGQGLARLAGHPMLLAWGARDFCFDLQFLAEWQRRFPAARCEVFDDASHYVLEDAADRLIPLVRTWMS
jgi:haloalkane dehalogenase